jgi:hypothetical protein
MRIIPAALLLICFLTQCKTNNAQSSKAFKKVVVSKVGDNYETVPNQRKSYALVQSKDSIDTAASVKYAVIRISDNEVVLDGKYNRGGYVKWKDDKTVEVVNIPAHIKTVTDTAVYRRQILLE